MKHEYIKIEHVPKDNAIKKANNLLKTLEVYNILPEEERAAFKMELFDVLVDGFLLRKYAKEFEGIDDYTT